MARTPAPGKPTHHIVRRTARAAAARDGQLSLNVGGKKPTSASLTLTGGKFDVEGQFKKGEIVVVQVECVVGEIAFKDLTDSKTNQVVGCARRHKARIVGSSIVESHPPVDLS